MGEARPLRRGGAGGLGRGVAGDERGRRPGHDPTRDVPGRRARRRFRERPAVRVLGAAETAARVGSGAYAGSLFDARAGTIQPLAYARGLARAAIAAVHAATGMVICPHTAVGFHAACLRRGDPATPMVVLATAHPAKFPDAVEAACGVRPALPPRMADLFERPERVTRVPDDLAVLEAVVGAERVA